MKNFLTCLFVVLPFAAVHSQDTLSLSELTYHENLYYYQTMPFTGIAEVKGSEMNEYYRYCTGEICGYMAFYQSGDTAGVHTYRGNDIHLVFYTKEGKKTLEYHQRILDQTYTFGEWIDYREDGSLLVKGNYKLVQDGSTGRGGVTRQWKSVRDGTWEYYNEKGDKIKTEVWRSDKLIRTKE